MAGNELPVFANVNRETMTYSTTPVSTADTMGPGIDIIGIDLGLTITFTVLYGVLFLLVYIQLWMILYYKHRRLSYQSVFLFLCLLWAGLRTTLYAFYYTKDDAKTANMLQTFTYWLLFCLPVCLQFTTLCLLVLFFAQVVFKAKYAKYEPNQYKRPLRFVIGIFIFVFLATNVTCAVLFEEYESNRSNPSNPKILPTIRVIINELMFLAGGIALSICIYKVSKISSANLVLEAKGTTVCQATTACVFIILLYTTRAVYNIMAVTTLYCPWKLPSFGYDWMNVSDQADGEVDLQKGYNFLTFGVVLFIWELLPTFVVVVFFRVQKPQSAAVTLADLSSHSTSRAYFFDNPRRYDSDEDLTSTPRVMGSQGDSSAYLYPNSHPYGSLNYSSSVHSHSGSYPSRSSSYQPPTVYNNCTTIAGQQQNFYDAT